MDESRLGYTAELLRHFADLAGLVNVAEQAGWTPVYAHVSDAAEWDNYEWSWIGSLTEWAVDNPGHPDAAEALTVAREHRDQWLRGYRDVLGFATLVLRRGIRPSCQEPVDRDLGYRRTAEPSAAPFHAGADHA